MNHFFIPGNIVTMKDIAVTKSNTTNSQPLETSECISALGKCSDCKSTDERTD